MNIKRLLLAMFGAFVCVFGFDFVVHGVLLMEIYDATSSLWRPELEYSEHMHYMLASQVLFSAFFAYMFAQYRDGNDVYEGVMFGFYFGLILASIQLATYSYMPIPFSLTLSWMMASLFKGVGTGAIVGKLYCKK